MKFKVGDKVRVVKNVWECDHEDVCIGEVHTIVEVDEYREYPYRVDKTKWLFCDEELELVQSKFTKADLKNGDFIVRRNGGVEIVIVDNGVCISKDGYNNLIDIAEDLTDSNGYNDEWDIVKVYRPTEAWHNQFDCYHNCNLVYERETLRELTIEEVEREFGIKVKFEKV